MRAKIEVRAINDVTICPHCVLCNLLILSVVFYLHAMIIVHTIHCRIATIVVFV